MDKVFSFVLMFVVVGVVSSKPQVLPNVDCAPHIDYVATDPGLYRYDPLYVKIHRCHGKHYASNPRNMRCLPKKTGISKVDFYGMNQLGKPLTLHIDNHTECSQECILTQQNCTSFQHFVKPECSCKCNYTKETAARLCTSPFVWQQSSCNCVCPIKAESLKCPNRKEFSTEECGCSCKQKFYVRCAKRKEIINEDTCYCDGSIVITGKSQSGCDGGVNGAMLAVVILVEAFAIVFCYYFFYAYCYKHNYLGRKKDKTNISSGYYHNGDVPSDIDRINGNNRNSHSQGYDETYSLTEGAMLTDKERIGQEEMGNGNVKHNGLSDKERIRLEEEFPEEHFPTYYPEEEKSPLAPKHPADRDYFYNDIMEVDGPPSSLDNHNLNLPPDYSDAISDLSDEDYGSVTQV